MEKEHLVTVKTASDGRAATRYECDATFFGRLGSVGTSYGKVLARLIPGGLVRLSPARCRKGR